MAMIKHLGAGWITGIAENLVNVLEGHHTHASANRQDKIPIDGTGCSGQPDERHRSTVYVFKDQSAHRAARVLKKFPHLALKTADKGFL